ncbi:beta-lactamase/transpeptidase-like protein [Mycena floridula]|nr:beta-lactamase/transpeptidase-like protein [Mycena floridula]
MKSFWLLVAHLLLIASSQISFQIPPSSRPLISAETHQYIDSLVKNSSGLAVAVVRRTSDGKWEKEFGSYGVATETGKPVTPSTVFAIASNSKLFLALSVGLLISNETLANKRGQKLKWTSKPVDVFKGTGLWGLWDKDAERLVNFQDMLSHRTGLPRHDMSASPKPVSQLRYLRPSAEVRQTFQYNNLMYEALSLLPSVLLNQSYESYISEHLFSPLNMTASAYSIAEAEERGTMADGFSSHMRYSPTIKAPLKAAVPFFQRPGEEPIWAGAGGVLSSTKDLSIWVSMLINNGSHPDKNETIVSNDVIQHVATGLTVSQGRARYPELSPKVYGCGQWRYTYQGHEIIEHGGSVPGYKVTQVTRFPNDDVGVIVLSNDENGDNLMETVRWRLSEDILGLERIDWESRYRKADEEKLVKKQSLPGRPADIDGFIQPPPKDYDSMLGTFYHPTYGSFTPCLVPSPSMSDFSSEACSRLFEHPVVQELVDAAKNITISPDSTPLLVVPFQRTFSSWILLRHFDGNTFNGSFAWSNWDIRQQEGYPDEGFLTTWEGFDDEERFVAEWVNEPVSGWSFKGNFWGAGDTALNGVNDEIAGKSGIDGAEVWFGRA